MDHNPLNAASGPCTVRLWLVRHARPMVPDGVCYGASDVPAGDDDTDAAAQRLSLQLPRHAPLHVSGLGRAQQLVKALRALRSDLAPAQVDSALNEMDFGEWELRPWDAIDRAALDAWAADFAHYRPGGRESVVQLLVRVQRALRRLAKAAQPATFNPPAREPVATDDAATHAIWVTHAGVIRAVQYLCKCPVEPVPSAQTWPPSAPPFGGVMVIDVHCYAQIAGFYG